MLTYEHGYAYSVGLESESSQKCSYSKNREANIEQNVIFLCIKAVTEWFAFGRRYVQMQFLKMRWINQIQLEQHVMIYIDVINFLCHKPNAS